MAKYEFYNQTDEDVEVAGEVIPAHENKAIHASFIKSEDIEDFDVQGYKVVISDEVEDIPEDEVEISMDNTKAEIVAYAKDKNIEIDEAATKQEILDSITK